jgi:hypothetical protein
MWGTRTLRAATDGIPLLVLSRDPAMCSGGTALRQLTSVERFEPAEEARIRVPSI